MDGQLPTPGSDYSQVRPRPLNFSRPRPTPTDRPVTRDRSHTSGSTPTVSAWNDSNSQNPPTPTELPGDFPPVTAVELPAEPRFSSDSDRPDTASTHSTGNASSAASEFAWDTETGELRSRRRPQEFDAQRARQSRTTTNTTRSSQQTAGTSTTAVNSDVSDIAELPGSQPPTPAAKPEQDSAPPPIPAKWGPKIVKRTSFDQMSERISISGQTTETSSSGGAGGWEDTASHHTVSMDGEGDGGENERRKWKSSDYDTSGLSHSEIQKLKKKGINPALYAEMKAARKGKGKWMGPLSGNSFLG
ncbi:hypothetical protein MBLNU230_g1568t1 [Neophaeotheca triangularis]